MTRIRDIKTTFTAGAVSRDLLGRGDLNAYANGALDLQNLFIFPTGGVTRRAGLRYVDSVPSTGRLIAFEFNTEQAYLLVLSDEQIDIYFEGSLEATLSAPWRASDTNQVVWTQSADTLLMTHPDYPPQKLTRTIAGWDLSEWSYYEQDGKRYQPYFKFENSGVSLTPSAVSGTITVTASAPIFDELQEGARLRIAGKEGTISDVASPTVASIILIEDLPDTNPTIDWTEQAFSAYRGYPVRVAFHQDRLVIGGSRDLPNRLWFSKSGDLFNFNLGEGLDDEAIEFAILSDQVNAIRGLFSGRHLQVFTSGAEWMVTGVPLTPTSVQLNRQTRVGSVTGRYIPPVNVDGATLFVARNRQEIREFLYTDLEQAYQATDLALLSRHIIQAPIDQDFDQTRRLLFLVREDGQFATLTVYRAEQVAAWTLHQTDGAVQSVAVVGESVYLLILRDGTYMIEEFDDTLYLDSALSGVSASNVTVWSGLDHLEGRVVSVLADGLIHDPVTVLSGSVTLSSGAKVVQIGLPFTHKITPLPPSSVGNAGGGRSVRLVEAIYRVENTQSLRLNVGRGYDDAILHQFGSDVLDDPPPTISGNVRVRAFGWQPDGEKPLWSIEQDAPLPFTLLSVTTELKVND